MNYDRLMEFKKNICLEYIKHYQEIGFEEYKPMPLHNKADITLDFTTCTICSAKENIKKNEKGKNYVMIQPALRNTHIDVLSQLNSIDFFFSFFSMMGGFKYYDESCSYVNQFSDIIKKEFDFLNNYSNKIVLTIPIQYREKLNISENVIDYLKKNNCIVKYSIDDEQNLKWKYGIANTVGYGTRWEIANGGDLVNWGNTINVFVNNKEFGVDFGGGIESLMYANLRLKSSIYANDAMTDEVNKFCNNEYLNEKMLDCMISSMCIIANKEKIILRDKCILDTYMSLLISYMILKDVEKNTIINLVNDINNKQINFLYHENMEKEFVKHLDNAIKNYNIILNSKNIDNILKLKKLCYNENADWKNNTKIINSHFEKYFSNLSEVELEALQKSKVKKLERKK